MIGVVTGDGTNEIIGVFSSATVGVFDNQGALLFSRDVPPRIQALGLADVTGDAHLEISG